MLFKLTNLKTTKCIVLHVQTLLNAVIVTTIFANQIIHGTIILLSVWIAILFFVMYVTIKQEKNVEKNTNLHLRQNLNMGALGVVILDTKLVLASPLQDQLCILQYVKVLNLIFADRVHVLRAAFNAQRVIDIFVLSQMMLIGGVHVIRWKLVYAVHKLFAECAFINQVLRMEDAPMVNTVLIQDSVSHSHVAHAKEKISMTA